MCSGTSILISDISDTIGEQGFGRTGVRIVERFDHSCTCVYVSMSHFLVKRETVLNARSCKL